MTTQKDDFSLMRTVARKHGQTSKKTAHQYIPRSLDLDYETSNRSTITINKSLNFSGYIRGLPCEAGFQFWLSRMM